MAKSIHRTNPELWERIKAKLMRSTKGGRAGQWSARKAQLAVQEYKKSGGGYFGQRDASNHLTQWTREDWGTKSGRRSRDTGERYLPKRARQALTDEEYASTSRKKRRDTDAGAQTSRQPRAIARKTAPYRDHHDVATRSELYEEARKRGISGRSRMTKADLVRALQGRGRAARA